MDDTNVWMLMTEALDCCAIGIEHLLHISLFADVDVAIFQKGDTTKASAQYRQEVFVLGERIFILPDVRLHESSSAHSFRISRCHDIQLQSRLRLRNVPYPLDDVVPDGLVSKKYPFAQKRLNLLVRQHVF